MLMSANVAAMDTNVNVELLRQELTWLTEHPERHNQNEWVGHPLLFGYGAPNRIRPEDGEDWTCQTTACLAGWVAIHLGWAPLWGQYPDGTVTRDGREQHASTVAEFALGLRHKDAEALFYDAKSRADLWDAASRITDGAIPCWADSPFHPVQSLPPATA